MPKKERQGIVVSDKMDKTVVVKVASYDPHPKYKKIIESNHADIIEKVYKPVSYLESLLNEIRCGKLKPTVKGNVWYIIGLI